MNEKNEFNFQGKYIIKFNLRVMTGLHIGGTNEGIEIGGVDNPVIKDPITGQPYIPGSSLKGKLRSLLEWALGKVQINDGKAPPHRCNRHEEANKCPVCRIFGVSPSDEDNEKVGHPTRLTIRDAYLFQDTIKQLENNLGKGLYTELKSENTIDRITANAMPRSLERVPKDSIFEVEMIFDIYQDTDVDFIKHLFMAMHLLEDSTLGGSGSRGSGKIRFENPTITYRSKEQYYMGNEKENGTLINVNNKLKPDVSIPHQLYIEFDNIFKNIKKE